MGITNKFKRKILTVFPYSFKLKARKVRNDLKLFLGNFKLKNKFKLVTSMTSFVLIKKNNFNEGFDQILKEKEIIHDGYIYVPEKKFPVNLRINDLLKEGYYESCIKFSPLNKGDCHEKNENNYSNVKETFNGFRSEKRFHFLTSGNQVDKNSEIFRLLKTLYKINPSDFYQDFMESELGWNSERNGRISSQSLFHYYYTKVIFENLPNINKLKGIRIFEVGPGFGGLLRTMVNEINNKSYNLKLIHHNFDMPYVQNLFSWFTTNDKICKKAQDNEFLNINICDISKFDFIKKKQEGFVDLFIATHSMTELDLSLINIFLEKIQNNCNYSMLSYQNYLGKILDMNWIQRKIKNEGEIIFRELSEGGDVTTIFGSNSNP